MGNMNNWASGLLGVGFGFLFAVIMFNISAQNAIEQNPEITMKMYWFQK